MSAVDDDLPKRYQPLCTVWVVPSDEAFEVPPSVCRFSGLVRAFLKEETGSCDFNLAHNYQHKTKNSVRKLNPFRVARFKFKTHVFKLVKG